MTVAYGGRPAAYPRPSRCLVETVYQRSRRLGVSELTVRRHIRDGRLQAVRIGGSWRIPAIDSREVDGLPAACTVRQVSNSLNVSDLTVRRWIASGVLPAVKQGRVWTVARDDLLDLVLGASGHAASPATPGDDRTAWTQ